MNFLTFPSLLSYFPFREKNYLCNVRCWRRKRHFDIPFWRNRSICFRWSMERTRPMRKKLDEKVFVSRESWHLRFDVLLHKSFFSYLYFDLACKHLCFLPRKSCEHEKRKCLKIVTWTHDLKQSFLVFPPTNKLISRKVAYFSNK